MAMIDPRTGREMDTGPDDVAPSELKTGDALPPEANPGVFDRPDLAPSTFPGASSPGVAAPVASTPASALADLAAPIVPPPPGAPMKSVTNEGSSTTTTRTVLSKEEKADHAELKKTLQAREGVVGRAGDVLASEADLKQAAADEKLKQQTLYQPQLDKVRDDAAKEYETKQKTYQDTQQNYAQAKPGSYWDNDPKGSKSFWSGIAMALGGFNASRTGGRNMAYEAIKDSVDRFDLHEKERIAKLKDLVGVAKDNRDEVMKLRDQRIADLAAKKSGALENAATLLEAKMSALGRPKAEIDKDDTILKVRELQQREDLDFDKASRRQISHTAVTKTQEIIGGTGPGGPAGAGAGRGIVDGRQRAMTAVGLQDQMKIIEEEEKKGHALTEEDRELIQRNKMYLHAIESGHSSTDAAVTDLMRTLGMRSAPKNAFDGLDPKKKRIAGASDLATQKGAVLAANGSVSEGAISHARGLTDFLAPALGPEEAQRRRQYIQKDLIDVNKNLVPELFRQASGEAPIAAAPNKAFLIQQAADLKKTIDAHPNHPRAAAAKAHLADLYRQIKS